MDNRPHRRNPPSHIAFAAPHQIPRLVLDLNGVGRRGHQFRRHVAIMIKPVSAGRLGAHASENRRRLILHDLPIFAVGEHPAVRPALLTNGGARYAGKVGSFAAAGANAICEGVTGDAHFRNQSEIMSVLSLCVSTKEPNQ